MCNVCVLTSFVTFISSLVTGVCLMWYGYREICNFSKSNKKHQYPHETRHTLLTVQFYF